MVPTSTQVTEHVSPAPPQHGERLLGNRRNLSGNRRMVLVAHEGMVRLARRTRLMAIVVMCGASPSVTAFATPRSVTSTRAIAPILRHSVLPPTTPPRGRLAMMRRARSVGGGGHSVEKAAAAGDQDRPPLLRKSPSAAVWSVAWPTIAVGLLQQAYSAVRMRSPWPAVHMSVTCSGADTRLERLLTRHTAILKRWTRYT